MALFNVDVLSAEGKKLRVQVDASNAQDAILKVKVRGYRPISVRPADGMARGPAAGTPGREGTREKAAPAVAETQPPQGHRPAPATARAVVEPRAGRARLFGGRVGFKQKVQFTHQFAVLMEAGLPVVRALKILAKQQKPGMLKNVISQTAEDVESGYSLSEAMSKHPRVFDRLYTNMVKAGEAGGVLEEVLRRLSEYMEKISALRRKVIGASIYPAIVMTIAIGVVLFIMWFIVPKFQEVFGQVGVALPGVTQLLMKVSRFMVEWWFVILLLPVFLYVGLHAWGRTKAGRVYIDRLKLRIPIIGPVVRKSAIARFCRTLGTLLKAGVPILDALTIVRNTTGNEVVAQAVGKVHDNVREGENIAGPLGASPVFDEMVINMVDVGEETGELDAMLLKIADIYDEEVDAAVSNLMSVIEPILILGLGGTILIIVLALFLPLTTLLGKLSEMR